MKKVYDWLDKEGCFLFGKYQGRMPITVVNEDSSYIKWLAYDCETISDEDRLIMHEVLKRKGF